MYNVIGLLLALAFLLLGMASGRFDWQYLIFMFLFFMVRPVKKYRGGGGLNGNV